MTICVATYRIIVADKPYKFGFPRSELDNRIAPYGLPIFVVNLLVCCPFIYVILLLVQDKEALQDIVGKMLKNVEIAIRKIPSVSSILLSTLDFQVFEEDLG